MIGVSFFKLRLIGEHGAVEFESSPSSLKRDVVDGFTRFLGRSLGKRASLEVFHPIHGWHSVCLDNTYLLIGSPLLINYPSLLMGLYETFNQCSQWPSPEQIRQRKAQARRSAFYLVKNDP